MQSEKVRLTQEKETMLGTLYGRALESRSADPILRDELAERVIGQIDYDFSKLGMNAVLATSIALRARQFDNWTAAFVAQHPDAVVLHLGCGLDSRVYRIDPPATVSWYDVDYPDVIDLRRRLYPSRESYTMLGSSVLEPKWIEEVPQNRPTLIVAEGLTMYLPEREAIPLFARLVSHFPSGELVCDTFSRVAIRLGKLNPVVRRTGSTLTWGLDDPRTLERSIPRLQLVEGLRAYDLTGPGVHKLPRRYTILLWLMRRIPPLGNLGRLLRYRF
jgi:O-methyltransferase involved in polyketide biosynthesis